MDQSSLFKVENFKAGFIAVIGLPNVGKSSLINAICGYKLTIVSPKPQTTRDHIKAILNGENFQMIFIDTPGFIKPFNLLEKVMLKIIDRAIKDDADLVCLVVDPGNLPLDKDKFIEKLKKINVPFFLVVNKVDIYSSKQIENTRKFWLENLPNINNVFEVSAKNGTNVERLKEEILHYLPSSPPYYQDGILSDRWERFFVSEIIRENIFNLYKDEVPYGCMVEIENFKDEENCAIISALIYVSKKNHKQILIGKNGSEIKRLREYSQKQISAFLNKEAKIQLWIKVKENWEKDINFIKKHY